MANSNEPVLEVTNNQEAEAKNIQRMADIQKCLDTSGLEKIPDSPNYFGISQFGLYQT